MVCARCASPLDLEALACPQCHALVYARDLEAATRGALAAEDAGQFAAARAQWTEALRRVPQDTTQAGWLLDRLRRIEDAGDRAPAAPAGLAGRDAASAPPPMPRWAARLGPLGPLALAALKGKALLSLLKLKSLLTLIVSMALYARLFGVAFGVGFVVLILIHEMGHFLEIRRQGLPADMPVFLPGIGAYVRWQALGVPLSTRAAISLAGPLAGTIAAIGCLAIYARTGLPLWAALGRAGGWLNAMNLAPIWILDGGQAVRALDRPARFALLTASVVLWLAGGESVFLLVGLAALWPIFHRDEPVNPSPRTAMYFIALLVVLAIILHIAPGQGTGFPQSSPATSRVSAPAPSAN